MASGGTSISFRSNDRGFQVGQNSGTINLAPASVRPETPPEPLSTVPFPRDPDYVHRGSIIDEIQRKLSIAAARVALVGLGGVGKSQLAIEHAHQVREESPETWVLWIHASSAARFDLSVRDVLDQLKVAGREDPTANALKLFRSWLRDARKGKWLLVLDNVDDANVLLEPLSAAEPTGSLAQQGQSGERRLDYLPSSDHGSILITTRSSDAALKVVRNDCIIAVEPMDEGYALKLVEKKLEHDYSQGDIARLARALDFMPLAMSQAAAYINRRAPRCSIQQYVEKLQSSDKSKSSVLDHDAGDLRRDREASNSIMLTWQISFEHIHNVRPSASDLLSLMSCFDRQSIPESLLQKRDMSRHEDGGVVPSRTRDRTHDDEDINSDSDHSNSIEDDQSVTGTDEFDEDITMLRSYSFISTTTDVKVFEMHRLVQLATQRWLRAHGRLDRWTCQFISNLDDAFPAGKYENWAVCQILYPHAKVALEVKPSNRETALRHASLMFRSAWYAEARGATADAERMAMRSVKSTTKELGPVHKVTLYNKVMLATIRRDLGLWDEAEKLELQVLEARKEVLGEKHPATLISMNNLALTYSKQRRLDEAAKLGAQVLEAQKEVLGERHPDTLMSMANLSHTLRSLGRRQSSLDLLACCATMSIHTLGPDHPDTLDRCRVKEEWEEEMEVTVASE